MPAEKSAEFGRRINYAWQTFKQKTPGTRHDGFSL